MLEDSIIEEGNSFSVALKVLHLVWDETLSAEAFLQRFTEELIVPKLRIDRVGVFKIERFRRGRMRYLFGCGVNTSPDEVDGQFFWRGVRRMQIESPNSLVTPTDGIGWDFSVLVKDKYVIAFDDTSSAREFTSSETAQLDDLARIVEEVLDRRTDLNTVREEARTDSLTGLLNKGQVESELKKATDMLRDKEINALCVAIIDADHFKNVNDTLGHDAGDAALRYLSQMTREILGDRATLLRFGGEELLVIYPDDLNAVAHLDDLRLAIKKGVCRYKDHTIPLTVSIGCCMVNAHHPARMRGTLGQQMFERADEALYAAKNNGRDRVMTLRVAQRTGVHSGSVPVAVER